MRTATMRLLERDRELDINTRSELAARLGTPDSGTSA
jgi:hypothetical protein